MVNQSALPHDPSGPPIEHSAQLSNPSVAPIATDKLSSPGAARNRPSASSGLDLSSDECDPDPDTDPTSDDRVFTHPWVCQGTKCGGARFKRYVS
jgi:hypothetical protein